MNEVCDDSTSGEVTYLKVLRHVLARLIQLVLVQDDVKHLRRTLGQLLSRHQLDINVTRLSLEKSVVNCQAQLRTFITFPRDLINL